MHLKMSDPRMVLFFCLSIGLFVGVTKAVLLMLCVYIVTGGWLFVKICLATIPRDLRSLIRYIKTKVFIYLLKRKNSTVPKAFQETARKYPNRIALLYQDEVWTFHELDEFSNRVANSFLDLGFHPGEEIALLMDSKPEFIGLWLGLSKAGIVTALMNTNLRKNSLIHSISVVNCRAVIFASEYTDAIAEIVTSMNDKRKGLLYFCYGKSNSNFVFAKPLKELIEESSSCSPATISKGNFEDRLFYIYTSGTTGLPKAAIIKHSRYFWIGSALRNLIIFNNFEIIYTCLPLYHLSAGILATCQCLIFGDTLAIRHKFSASNFWTDCIKYKCTAAQYIGEICRYLLLQKEKPAETAHKVRLMFGNGLRPKIWRQFVERFKIKQIGEFYGSTEGNANVINIDNKEGSCGFISRIMPSIYPVGLIKIDENTNEPIRDENGMCLLCQGDDCGQFVGKIVNGDPSRAFDGYVDEEASKKKIIRDVFRKGDTAFLSGDLLFMDIYGYLSFKDRTGDTFRWKGENVSTCEVESIISNFCGLTDCVVYGVEVPNCEGKAGMAVIVKTTNGCNIDDYLNSLLTKMYDALPPFSIPMFIRLVSSIESTGTFKLTKNNFYKEGINPQRVNDPLYILDGSTKMYKRLDDTVYSDLIRGKFRL